MATESIHTIDLRFRGRAETIAVYLIPHAQGCILIESGPGSTLPALTRGIRTLGYDVSSVTDVFLTHIHLDHAGSAGWWAQQGAQIHVHPNGAPHLLNPEKLLASASRLYGNMMDELWGDFLPVAPERLVIMQDDDSVDIGAIKIHAIDVPGHASHHLAYFYHGACFTGDIGGIRLSPMHYLRLPLPPPDLHLGSWRESILHIQQLQPDRIIPTHFGVYTDVEWHLQAVVNALYEIEAWVEKVMPGDPSLEELRGLFIQFEQQLAQKFHIDPGMVEAQEIANPSFMSADGIYRYWNKVRKGN